MQFCVYVRARHKIRIPHGAFVEAVFREKRGEDRGGFRLEVFGHLLHLAAAYFSVGLRDFRINKVFTCRPPFAAVWLLRHIARKGF